MTIDLCLEAYGTFAHLVGGDAVSSMLPLRWRLGRLVGSSAEPARRPRPPVRPHPPYPLPPPPGPTSIDGPDVAAPPDSAGLEARVWAAVERLPFLLAHVLWLVDVCRCSYDTAAAELGTSPERIEELVTEARRRVRHDPLVAAIEPPGPDR